MNNVPLWKQVTDRFLEIGIADADKKFHPQVPFEVVKAALNKVHDGKLLIVRHDGPNITLQVR